MRDVAKAKGNRIKIEAVVIKWQAFGIRLDPCKALHVTAVDGAFLADAQHFGIQVADGNLGILAGFFAVAESDIARTSCNIEKFFIRRRTHHAHKTVFPKAVDAS